jgi:hypothetical protein
MALWWFAPLRHTVSLPVFLVSRRKLIPLKAAWISASLQLDPAAPFSYSEQSSLRTATAATRL